MSSERDLDLVLDHVYELNPDTPKIFNSNNDQEAPFSCKLFFGLDTKLFLESLANCSHHHQEGHHQHHHHEDDQEIDVIDISIPMSDKSVITRDAFTTWLLSLSKDRVFRVKGFIWLDEEPRILYLVNHAFGRPSVVPFEKPDTLSHQKLSIIGLDLYTFLDSIESFFQASNKTINYVKKKSE